ncbi:hypothetical protein LCGC14_1610610 [marine sediment metagenome]|uniref:Uncharacterized protein n=1 Tax=marine sediment metagenome TaxID=412755 RepID=A0A0F9I8F6_9ZZZZ
MNKKVIKLANDIEIEFIDYGDETFKGCKSNIFITRDETFEEYMEEELKELENI